MRKEVEAVVSENHLEGKIKLLGTKSQADIPEYMHQADVFILPCLYDGWGAVVNEALQAGCYVICSDAAGASDLIKCDARLGLVFKRGNVRQLAECISWCNENINDIRAKRDFRKEWAEEHISGTAVGHYMIDCLLE